jgi:Flp pilus assembly protein TadD
MRADKLRRLCAGLTLFVSPLLFGQQNNLSYLSLADPPDDPAEESFGERPHSVFDRLERKLAQETWPRPESSSSPAGTVSVEQLRHPLTRKGGQLLERAQRYAKAGEHRKAIQEFLRALGEASAAPYAHSLLGIEYLKIGDLASATSALLEAVRVLPGIAANHTNLGYALCLTGQRKPAERELREAVRLDRTSPQARYLLGLIQLDQRSPEAAQNLGFAMQDMHKARLALAIAHVRAGDLVSARQDIRHYLGLERLQESDSTEQWVAQASILDHPSVLFGLP